MINPMLRVFFLSGLFCPLIALSTCPCLLPCICVFVLHTSFTATADAPGLVSFLLHAPFSRFFDTVPHSPDPMNTGEVTVRRLAVLGAAAPVFPYTRASSSSFS